jgi:nicotinate-nucleotide adenylyltransferase
LRLAEELCDVLALAQVRIIPASVPPHRAAPRVTSQHRLEMARLAVQGNSRFVLDERECRRDGPSYTVDTLTDLRVELGTERPICLLMGIDAFLGLTTWSRWRQLFDLAHVVIAHRPGFSLDVDALPQGLADEVKQRLAPRADVLHHLPAGSVLRQTLTPLDISATAIRAEIRAGRSVRYLLPDSVLDYIHRNQLYKDVDAR